MIQSRLIELAVKSLQPWVYRLFSNQLRTNFQCLKPQICHTEIQISDFSWEIGTSGHSGCAFAHGNYWLLLSGDCPLQEAILIHLSSHSHPVHLVMWPTVPGEAVRPIWTAWLSQMAPGSIPAWPRTSCVTLGKLLDFSESQVLDCKMR